MWEATALCRSGRAPYTSGAVPLSPGSSTASPPLSHSFCLVSLVVWQSCLWSAFWQVAAQAVQCLQLWRQPKSWRKVSAALLSSLTLSGTTCKNLLIFSGKKTGQLLRFSYSSGEVNASLLLAPRQQSQGCVWGTISEVSRKGLTGSCLKQSSSWCLTEYITITGWLSSPWRFAFKLNYLGSLVLSHSWKGLF